MYNVNKILSMIYTREYVQCVKMMRIVISLGLCGLMFSSSAIVFGNMTGKVNGVMRVTKNWLLIGFELGPLVGNVQL